ncbi:glycosyltransferase family 2 protein [Aureitalea marina]|uniref:Glycosyltransferase 2-like domain-containing protein n=1 Tax=Aureitalea marina TaxID=930804 RepID=A0A2S7KMU0_9FLAO|nr:glycosyltransferase family 2 protein [Aureitalea marina]PQB03883.1 hypothetical protein BST85_02400 [Aureitalea marina]
MIAPSISVITINFNDSAGLKRTLDSVFSQSYSNLESVVIDGGSTDSSAQVIQSRINEIGKWVSEPDRGIYNAMNKGIKLATGDFILFLNSGDVFTTDESLAKFVQHPNFKGDIIYGDYNFGQGEKLYPDRPSLYFLFKSSLPHQSTLFKADVFERVGLYNEEYKITSDREFYIKALVRGDIEFSHVDVALTTFDQEGISNDPNSRALKQEENHEMLREHFGPFYDDYLQFIQIEHENNRLKRGKLVRFWARFKRKVFGGK